ncbi:MAG: hypothetical protein JEY94_08325 [Melioribacteraceae bacterium]|nr:hypothetical protein [Melioribacteraceae bacterium]
MKKLFAYTLFIGSFLLVLSSCSELNDDITVEPTNMVSVHKDGFGKMSSENFHGKTLAKNNWNIKECRSCHGFDYSGGTAESSCNTCHTNGPDECNTCHGNFANPKSIAPPTDLAGNIESTYPGVGAHVAHVMNEESVGQNVGCFDCHPSTSTNEEFVFAHINELPAEVNIRGLAAVQANPASYDYTGNTCSNVYCHGHFEFSKASSKNQWVYTADKMEGNKFNPKWTKVDDTQGACGTCHDLPPKGHAAVSGGLASCTTCHWDVVDNEGKIKDNLKHINGEINVYGN